MATRKRGKKTAFVPRSLFSGAVGIGVIPICVSACGGQAQVPESSGSSAGSSGASSGGVSISVSGSRLGGVSSGAFSVASGAFGVSSGAFGVALSGFDAAVGLSVAAMGFDGGPPPSIEIDVAAAGFASPEPSVEAGGTHDATGDAPELTVAFVGFDASTQGHDADDQG